MCKLQPGVLEQSDLRVPIKYTTFKHRVHIRCQFTMLVRHSVRILVPVCHHNSYAHHSCSLSAFHALRLRMYSVRCLKEVKKMERETDKLQELRSAPSVFDTIICSIFSHTVGLQLLTWTDCKVASDNLTPFPTLLPLRRCCHDLHDPYYRHFLQLFFFTFPGLGYSEDGGSKLLRRPITQPLFYAFFI